MRMIPFIFAIVLTAALAPNIRASDISPQGKKLSASLDSLDVEHNWDAGKSVAWKTGKPLENQSEYRKGNTHCSAFVAAACLKLDIYILRPPEHSSKLLANAQAEWLANKGAEKGWTLVKTAFDAQRLANQGNMVVAVFQEPNPERSGHIAIIRPSDKPETKIRTEGPQIVQAGATNSNSTTLVEGFKHHKTAWPNGVRYYVHAITFK